jgi:membrane protein
VSEVPDDDCSDYADPACQLKPAGSPYSLPWRAWRRAAGRTAAQFGDDNIALVAAGCTFFTLLALFPALSAATSLYGLIARPERVAQDLERLRSIVPGDAFSVISRHTERLTEGAAPVLGLSLAITLLISLWSASRAANALMAALNIVYDERETRGFIRLNLQILFITVVAMTGLVVMLLAVVGIPAWLNYVWLDEGREFAIGALRWPILGLFVGLNLCALYRLAPSRAHARWYWLTPGAIAASLLWIVASWLFSFYVTQINNFSGVYGSFGALIVLLMWMFFSYMIVLLGAELNAELEHEVAADTTTGTPKPLGQRNAAMADKIAGVEDLSAEKPKEGPVAAGQSH